jgi:SAM-dependent methyltransferase
MRDKTMDTQESRIRNSVDNRYRRVAVEGKKSGYQLDDSGIVKIYTRDEIDSVPEDISGSSCACGNSVEMASLNDGEVVLDLGSGAGMDSFLAARKVGSTGNVIGVDRNQDMLEKARKAAIGLDLSNVEFRKGEIESLPIDDESVDVVISNCVINLVTDKDSVFREAFRVLRPGGRLAISDRVLRRELPEEARRDLDLWSACVSGALMEEDYIRRIENAGFENVEVRGRGVFSRRELEGIIAPIARKRREEDGHFDEEMAMEAYLSVASDRLVAWKPRS